MHILFTMFISIIQNLISKLLLINNNFFIIAKVFQYISTIIFFLYIYNIV